MDSATAVGMGDMVLVTAMDMEDMVLVTLVLEATTASVRLRLSPRLLLIPGTTVDMDMVDTDSGLMDLDTDTVDSTTESKISLRPD